MLIIKVAGKEGWKLWKELVKQCGHLTLGEIIRGNLN